MRRINLLRGWDELTAEQRGEVEDALPDERQQMIYDFLNYEIDPTDHED
jgi:hypothetical protein